MLPRSLITEPSDSVSIAPVNGRDLNSPDEIPVSTPGVVRALAGVALAGRASAGMEGLEAGASGGEMALRTAVLCSATKPLLFSPNTPVCERIAVKPVTAVMTPAVAVSMPGTVAHQLPLPPDSSLILVSNTGDLYCFPMSIARRQDGCVSLPVTKSSSRYQVSPTGQARCRSRRA